MMLASGRGILVVVRGGGSIPSDMIALFVSWALSVLNGALGGVLSFAGVLVPWVLSGVLAVVVVVVSA